MAIGKYIGTCAECGAEFEYRKVCSNRTEADRYEDWARENITVCKACAAKAYAAQAADRVAEILQQYDVTLPQITGVSDKQIAYAESIRARALGKNLSELERYCKTLQGCLETARDRREEILAGLAKLGAMTIEEGISKAMTELGLGDMHKLMMETSARKIIDARI